MHEMLIAFFDDYLIENNDQILIIAGDFNHFNVVDLCDVMDLTDIVNLSTSGKMFLTMSWYP